MATRKLLTNGNAFKRTDSRWGGTVWYMDESGERKRKCFSGTTKQEVNKKMTAYIPDNPDIYEFMTGIAYLNFIADVYGVSAEERKARIEKYAGMFEISADLGAPVSSYSHGMRQKLAIIAALIHAPKLLILDEPFVGLDPKASHLLKQIFRDMCESGTAIFFSTHVLEVAQKLCNKIAIIKNGRLVVSGDTKNVVGDGSLEEVFLELADVKGGDEGEK